MFSVKVNRTNGGIGRQAAGTDYYGGILYYIKGGSTLPTGFATNQIQLLRSINDLIALGITGNSADETASTGTWLCTNAGVAGETVTLIFTDPITGIATVLGTATVPSTPTTTTTATAFAAAINAQSYLTGFTATSSTATVTWTAKPGYGVSLNTGTPYAVTYSSSPTVAGTLTQNVVAGVGSEQDAIYYNVREAFRMQGVINGNGAAQGMIWLGIYKATSTTYANFTEIATMQAFSGNQIKTLLVCGIGYTTTTFRTFATSEITAVQAQITTLQGLNTPLKVVYQPNLKGVTTANFVNLLTLTAPGVQVVCGQDGANVGNKIYQALGASIGCGGTTLGVICALKVMQSQGWRGGVNVVDSLEYTTLAFCNGALFSSFGSNLNSTQTGVDAYGWVFLMNETVPESSALYGGVFYSSDQTAVTGSSNYSNMPNNRTIDKAVVGVRAAILPALGGNVYFNANGTLTTDSLLYLQSLGDSVIGNKAFGATVNGSMTSAGEISEGKTIIDPTQNVQSTQNLAVTMEIVQAGVLRSITINIGYVASL